MIPAEYKALGYISLSAALLCTGAAAAWYTTSDHYQKILAEERLQHAEIVNLQLTKIQGRAAERAAKITNAEVQHAKDQLFINSLRAQSGRVRIHFPPGGCTLPGTPRASADTGGGAGVLSERVDAAFADLQAGVDRLAARCDQLNIDARQQNAGGSHD